MNNNRIYGIFDDENLLLSSLKELRSNNIKIHEVYTPFPVHGLDKALGIKETRMGITAFIYGVIGFTFAAILIYYIMILNWPQNIGGKPNWTFYHNMPAFVPILFECTVMFAAHLMSITFLFRCGLFPGAVSDSPDIRTTDDKFLIEIDPQDNEEIIIEKLNNTGVTEINRKKS